MLHATVRGEGQTVLLLHSTGLSSRQWGALVPQLETTHRVAAVDLAGYGKSPAFDDTKPFALADDVAAVTELFPSEPVHLVGHSYGGLLALQLALHHPDRVRSVAVYDPVAFGVLRNPDDSEGLADLASIDSPMFRDEVTGGNADWLRGFVDYWNRRPTWDALPQNSRDAFLRGGRKAFREVMQVVNDTTSAAAYALNTAPTLVLNGGASPAAAQRVGVRLAEALPNVTHRVLPDLGHMAPVTDGVTINAAFTEHVRANS